MHSAFIHFPTSADDETSIVTDTEKKIILNTIKAYFAEEVPKEDREFTKKTSPIRRTIAEYTFILRGRFPRISFEKCERMVDENIKSSS